MVEAQKFLRFSRLRLKKVLSNIDQISLTVVITSLKAQKAIKYRNFFQNVAQIKRKSQIFSNIYQFFYKFSVLWRKEQSLKRRILSFWKVLKIWGKFSLCVLINFVLIKKMYRCLLSKYIQLRGGLKKGVFSHQGAGGSAPIPSFFF